MNCDFCGNKATVFFTQLVDGKMKKICLCESCANEKGVTDPTGFSMADLLHENPAIPMAAAQGPRKRAGVTKTCPHCGFSLDDLMKVRRFGCSECYRTFSEEVSQMVRGMHKGVVHQGKVPAGLIARQVIHERIDDLRTRLESAVASESYEEAAGLRDEIQGLRAQLEITKETEDAKP